jgi:hypothetical protein
MFWPKFFPGNLGLFDETLDMTPRMCNTELSCEMLLSKCTCLSGYTVSNLFRRLVECLCKLFELFFREFRWPSKTFVVVERVYKIALFEAV